MVTKDIEDLIEDYYNVTGITVFYMNDAMEVGQISRGLTVEQLNYLAINEVRDFVKKIFCEKKCSKDIFYTFHTTYDCVYNIVALQEGKKIKGVLISGAMALAVQKEEQIESILGEYAHLLGRKQVLDIVGKVSVVNYRRLKSLGKILASLANSTNCKTDYQQVYMGSWSENKQLDKKIERIIVQKVSETYEEGYFLPDTVYYKLKEIIVRADATGMEEFISDLGSIALDRLFPDDSIESLKACGIAANIGCFCFAVESNAPYYPMSVLATTFISLIEQQSTMHEVLNLIRKILLTYIQEVEKYSHQSFSKPVKQSMKYIQNNIHRKTTLNELATHTGVSPFYLSTLMKKETKLSLTDNINRIRIEESKHLLLNTNMSILEIAQTMGFSYQNHFAMVFKKKMGQTPTEFRNNG